MVVAFVVAVTSLSCSTPRENSERDAERAIAKAFDVKDKNAKVDVDSKTGVIKVEGKDSKYVKGDKQGRPLWLPEGLPLPDDLAIDVSAEIGTERVIRSLRGTTKLSVALLRTKYQSVAASIGLRVAPNDRDAAIPGTEVLLLAYTKSGVPLDIRLSPSGDFDLYLGRFWTAPPTSATTAG